MPELNLDSEAIAEIAARMDLRRPNRDALETIALALSHYYGPLQGQPPYEAVVVSATGVGKTYILAATIEYLARVEGIRNFAVITPGRTILEKTVANFSPGHPKSLLPVMDISPVVITSDNFDSAATRAAMDNPEQVKLYIFTVQSLTRPTSRQGRRTHEFREGLGEAFYEHLQRLEDLIMFADEHHCYYGSAFSSAIRDLVPKALIGLTATPHPRTPDEQIIFRYPLAAAVADGLVKTPVIVGRHDDRSDPFTQLTDGIRLLELKERVMREWCEANGLEPVHPVMLVVAQTIEDANVYAEYVRSSSFMEGRYANAVLTVHSDAPDEALKQLESVESPDSPIRIIISVGMLKEGWDVKNVYVLASMRASVSDILTEQTLGRGLRLPFGKYTGIEMLDTLEVLAHERYDELLRRTGVMNEQLRDYRTRLILQRNEDGEYRVSSQHIEVRGLTGVSSSSDSYGIDLDTRNNASFSGTDTSIDRAGSTTFGLNQQAVSGFRLEGLEERSERHQRAVEQMREMDPKPGLPPLMIPVLCTESIAVPFSLVDIVDLEPFRSLGRRLATNPDQSLRRERVRARIVEERGLRRTEIYTERAQEPVYSKVVLRPMEDLVSELVEAVLRCEVVPERPVEIEAAKRLVNAFVDGLGANAQEVLSGYLETAKAHLVETVIKVAQEQRRNPRIQEVIEWKRFAPKRIRREGSSPDRHGPFRRGQPYTGWAKSMYEQAWFDSEPERHMARILDDSPDIRFWVRLERGDLPILWGQDRTYSPDFIAVDTDNVHWVIEVKSDRDMDSPEVNDKKMAAQRWVNMASLDPQGAAEWRYLLVSERTLHDAHDSWRMLRTLAGN